MFAVLLAGLMALPGIPANAQSATAGKIVFSSTRADLNTDIYLMNLDGTGIQRLTYDTSEDVQPALSPDGTKVAFVSSRGLEIPAGTPGSTGREKSEIYIVNVDGSGLRKLTDFGTVTGHPVWSPDGTQIAYVGRDAAEATHVYKISATGGAPTMLADASYIDITWNHRPSGDFIRYAGREVTSGGISRSYPYTMKPDGTGQQIEFTAPPLYSPDGSKYIRFDSLQSLEIHNTADSAVIGHLNYWALGRITFSADSQKVVFSGNFPGNDNNNHYHIYTANINGTGLTQLTRAIGSDDFPSCGPGLTVPIPTAETGFGRLVLQGNDGIFTMNPTGWGMQRLEPVSPTGAPVGPFYHPKWNKAGTRIAMDDHQNLFTMAADGTDLQQVTHLTAGYAVEPSWNSAGTALAFTFQDGSPFYYHERIHTIKVDGSGDTEIPAVTKSYGTPAWQPASDGTDGAIAFFQGAAYLESSIGINYGAQSNSAVLFTNQIEGNSYDAENQSGTGLYFGSPAWNPTGTRLAVVRTERRRPQSANYAYMVSSNILMSNPDGSDVVPVTNHILSSSVGTYDSLSFSPDGTEFAFLEGQTLGTMNVDGTGSKPLFGNGVNQVNWGANFISGAPEVKAPSVIIADPAAQTTRKLLKISGTIDDTGVSSTGPALVMLKLQRLTDNKYWNPAAIAADKWSTTEGLIPGNVGTADPNNSVLRPWAASQYDLPPPELMPTGSYRIIASGIDNAGNISNEIATTFSISSPGQLAFTSPGYTINEASGISIPGAVTVSRLGGSDGTVTVEYRATNYGVQGEAQLGADFTLPAGTLTFNPGETLKTIPLQVLNDAILESSETFAIELSNPTGGADFGEAAYYSISPITSYITISDDEAALAGRFHFTPGIKLVLGNQGSVELTVQRTGGSLPEDVSFSMLPGDTIPARFTNVPQVLHFGATEMTKTVTVPLLDNSDSLPDQNVFLYLQTPVQYQDGLLIIRDKNYAPPEGFFSFAQHEFAAVDNGNGVDLTIQRIGGTTGDTFVSVGVDFDYNPGTAGSSDYSFDESTVKFGDGDATPKTIHLNIATGAAGNSMKTFNLLLYAGRGYPTDAATVTVTHDDSLPGIFELAESAVSAVEGSAVTLTVNRTGGSAGAANVPFIVEGTAIKNKDYTVNVSSPIHFASGEISKQIQLQLLGDTVADPAETAIIVLGDPSLGELGENSSEIVTIDDGPSGLMGLTVATIGSGSVTKGFLGQTPRNTGTKYTVTATPAAGYIFAGWTGGITSNNAKLSFTMSPELSLTANFVLNPFLAVSGSYIGLAQAEAAGIDPSLVTMALRETGSFTGSIACPAALRAVLGAKLPFTGTFTASGHYTRSSKVGALDLLIELQHSAAAGGTITGTVQVGANVFTLAAGRAAYSAKHPAPMAGLYTMSLVPKPGETTSPRGHGVATLSVASSGTVKVTGTLADGTTFSVAGPITGTNGFILFKPLYAQARGQLTASMLIVSNNNPADTDIQANFLWIRPPAVNDGKPHLYASGFSTALTSLASVYHLPEKGKNVFGTAQSTIDFGTTSAAVGSHAIAHASTLNDKSQLSYTGTDKISGAFAEKTGLFKGSFTAAGTTASQAFGIVLDKQNIALGFYFESGLSSDLSLKP
ncbi:MAG: Na-Ca exchanger/integrin-beta4 [Chthoniobacteraceae bacterium]|nr:Na-Ca exchanger/integrin-beta4 [Chthoniobacteraceae bacterium]